MDPITTGEQVAWIVTMNYTRQACRCTVTSVRPCRWACAPDERRLHALGVPPATDGQFTALVEIDRNHCATCYEDGVQVITGCTFGKGNIRSLGYGKFALTLIDNKTGRSVRVMATRKPCGAARNRNSSNIARTACPPRRSMRNWSSH